MPQATMPQATMPQATMPQPPISQDAIPNPVPVKPKLKKVIYKKKLYLYSMKVDESEKIQGYILYNPENTETPVGFVLADPVTKVPKGDIQPIGNV